MDISYIQGNLEIFKEPRRPDNNRGPGDQADPVPLVGKESPRAFIAQGVQRLAGLEALAEQHDPFIDRAVVVCLAAQGQLQLRRLPLMHLKIRAKADNRHLLLIDRHHLDFQAGFFHLHPSALNDGRRQSIRSELSRSAVDADQENPVPRQARVSRRRQPIIAEERSRPHPGRAHHLRAASS